MLVEQALEARLGRRPGTAVTPDSSPLTRPPTSWSAMQRPPTRSMTPAELLVRPSTSASIEGLRAQSRGNLTRLGQLGGPRDSSPRRFGSLDPMSRSQRERQRAESLAPSYSEPRQDLCELSAQTKALGLRHGAASYALLATPLTTSFALRISAGLDAQLADLEMLAEAAGGALADEVGVMQVWTDAFAELVIQARTASAEWAHLLERIYRFFTSTVASMLRALQVANLYALEERCAKAEAERASALSDLRTLHTTHASLLEKQPAALRDDDTRNATIVAFLDGAPGDRSKQAALLAVLGTISTPEQMAALVAERFGDSPQRADVALRLVGTLSEASKGAALADILDSQHESTRSSAIGRAIKSLPAREWANLLPSVAKSLPRGEGTRWALEIGKPLKQKHPPTYTHKRHFFVCTAVSYIHIYLSIFTQYI
ncbi:hypothetical protein T492DRAFT_959214 [Pavlovales sp. CCMP2436]|nr:hypothetical protein T492DRAFT_959214 [Pavlovales sp. CCMP2436]